MISFFLRTKNVSLLSFAEVDIKNWESLYPFINEPQSLFVKYYASPILILFPFFITGFRFAFLGWQLTSRTNDVRAYSEYGRLVPCYYMHVF